MTHYWNCPSYAEEAPVLPQGGESEPVSEPTLPLGTPEAETGSEDALGPQEAASEDGDESDES